MSVVRIVKGAEFRINVNEEIKEDDIFFKQYERAAAMLDDIVGASARLKDCPDSWSWKHQDFENNVIAFCGERGEGKSSAMMTFVNAVYSNRERKNPVFSSCRHLENTFFSEPLLIDPSQFDDVHNVLDLILARIFQDFDRRCDYGVQYADERTRERLLDRFQTVYRYISLVNNQKQMLDDEFDYEGNISKLTKLGESTNLKKAMAELIRDYLDFRNKNEKNQQLIIAIDDLDLCSANAYKMAEQIRKYLIIPQVTVVISVRIEQLELCIREKNLRDFRKLYENRDDEVYQQLNQEIQTMAERYMAKLIPKQRRIYLPKVQSFDDVHILYMNSSDGGILWDSAASGNLGTSDSASQRTSSGSPNAFDSDSQESAPGTPDTFTSAMLKLIFLRTGMSFLPEGDGTSYLLPDNLRDMISWLSMIAGLKDPAGNDEIYLENIEAFEWYFQKEWAADHLKLYDGLTLQEIGQMDSFHMHVTMLKILRQIAQESNVLPNPAFEPIISDRSDSFYRVMHLFDFLSKNIADRRREDYIYQMRTLYTIRIHRLFRSSQEQKLAQFINGYIWGPDFNFTLPIHQNSGTDRSRFVIETAQSMNKVLDAMNSTAPRFLLPENGNPLKASSIADHPKRNDYIKAWILLGLLSNIFYSNNNGQTIYSSEGSMIYDNSNIIYYIQISLENYLTGLCNLDALYHKINIGMLGITYEEFQAVIRAIEESNSESIACARSILSNLDLTLKIKDYCIQHREYRKGTKDETERSRKLVDTFFRNISAYMKKKQYGVACSPERLELFSFGKQEITIDVSALYAELFDLSVQNIQYRKEQEENKKVEEAVITFQAKLTIIPDFPVTEGANASTFLRNWSANNAKSNLDLLASKVQCYLSRRREQPAGLDVNGLCSLYASVERMYLKDQNANITQEMHEEYKRLLNVQTEIVRYLNGH